MKKQVLTLVGILILGVGVTAATTTHTFFNVVNPDITISVSKHRVSSTSGWWEDALAQFTLTGTGTASGSIDTSTDGYTMPWQRGYNTTNNPNLWGGYTATGDFQSEFRADTYCSKGWHADSYVTYNFLDVTAATTLGVQGDATAVTADSATSNAAGQVFGDGYGGFGEAESVYVEAARQVIDHHTSTWAGAYMNATAAGTPGNTVEFRGYTEGRYYHATHHYDLAVPEMGSGGISQPHGEGFGYDIAIATPGSSLNGFFTSSYSYQASVTEPLEIRGEAGIWTPTWGPWYGWTTYPGNHPVYGDPVP